MAVINQFEGSIDEDVDVGFAEFEDRGPVFEYAAWNTDLGFGVYGGVGFIFALPGGGC